MGSTKWRSPRSIDTGVTEPTPNGSLVLVCVGLGPKKCRICTNDNSATSRTFAMKIDELDLRSMGNDPTKGICLIGTVSGDIFCCPDQNFESCLPTKVSQEML